MISPVRRRFARRLALSPPSRAGHYDWIVGALGRGVLLRIEPAGAAMRLLPRIWTSVQPARSAAQGVRLCIPCG